MFSKNIYPYLIAEVGNSHEGDFKLCKKSIIEAKRGGANCVKFQLFNHKTIVNPKLKTIKHANSKFKFQFERFKSIELNLRKVKILSKIAKKNKIDFSVSVFDPDLVSPVSKYISFFKVASGDLNYIDLLKEIKKTKKKAILSTGMANVEEIQNAIKILGKKNCKILHCISKYPTNNNELNLNSIPFLKKKLKMNIGFSDHSVGIDASITAAILGANIIEKHFYPTGSNKNSADKVLSINKDEFFKMKKSIKDSLDMLGENSKKLFDCEKYYQKNLRRSVYFYRNLKKGSVIKKKDLIFLRPFNNNGIKITEIEKIIGKKVKKDYKKFSLVQKI